ncbi:MAG: hypothetical protein AAB393_11415, partial [Bacteroidota bacterium]
MPNHHTGTQPSTAPSAQRTAQEVIDMFNELGLLVCDDGDEIKKRVDNASPRYLQMKRQTDPKKWVVSDKWFKNVEALQNHRPELLRFVYEQFERLADTSLKGAIGQGLATLNQPLIDALNRIAQEDCRVDDQLGKRFLDDYLRDRELEIGGEIVRPALVEDFTAVSGLGEITLSWSLPAQNCEKVELLREEEFLSAGKKPSRKSKTVYSGRGTSCVDKDVSPGSWYTYQAHSIY